MPILPARDSLSEFEQGQLTLASHDGVNKGLAQSLMRGQTGVPSAEHNRQSWAQFLDRLGDSYRGADMRPGQDGNAQQRASSVSRRMVFS